MLTPVWCWASVSDPFVISGFSVNTIKSSFCIILSWWIMLPLKKTSNWLGKLEWCSLSSHILYTSPGAWEYWRIHAHYSNRLTVPPLHTLYSSLLWQNCSHEFHISPLAFFSYNHSVPTHAQSLDLWDFESKHIGVLRHSLKVEEWGRHFQPFASWFYLCFGMCCACLINLRCLLVMHGESVALMSPLPSSSLQLAAEAVLAGPVSAKRLLLINSAIMVKLECSEVTFV